MNIVNVGYDSANYFVIAPAAGRGLLVDCGWPGTMGKLKGQMKRKGIALSDIRHLLVTHYHPDHAGLTQELRNAGMTLLLMEPQVPFVADLKNHIKPGFGYVEIIIDKSSVLRLEDSRAFLKREGIEGQIVPTPGHSPDSVSLVLDEGAAFVGDLTHPLLLTADDTTCRDSWERIYALGARLIFPAHGTAPYNREAGPGRWHR